MSRFRVDPDAREDLQRIHRYIARDNPAAARRVVESIRERFRLLSKWPQSGECVNELSPGMRRYSVGSYVVYFRVKDRVVEILRVLHGAQDAEGQLWPR